MKPLQNCRTFCLLLGEQHQEVAICFTLNERCLNYVRQFEQTEFGFAYCEVSEKVTMVICYDVLYVSTRGTNIANIADGSLNNVSSSLCLCHNRQKPEGHNANVGGIEIETPLQEYTCELNGTFYVCLSYALAWIKLRGDELGAWPICNDVVKG